MDFFSIYIELKKHLISSFALLDSWFDKEELLGLNGPEIISEFNAVLENTSTLNAIILQALPTEHVGARGVTSEYDFDYNRLNGLSQEFPKYIASFKSTVNLVELRATLRDQLYSTLLLLDLFSNGEAVGHKIQLDVFKDVSNEYDVYELLYMIGAINMQAHRKLVIAESMGVKVL